jgi:hypothetical protein
MGCSNAAIELVSTVQEEIDFIKSIVFEEEVFKNIAFPGITEVFVEKVN